MAVTLVLVVACCTAMAVASPPNREREADLPNASALPAGPQVTVEMWRRGSEIVVILGKDAPEIIPDPPSAPMAKGSSAPPPAPFT